jgi:Zn-dependent M28 family amino/carboxypeptidase
VAAVLEIARALRQGAPLRNDVIFLLTDGEEYGLFGARAFLRHPWAKEVGLVINLEGRGNRGPSLSFEISPQNGWIVREMAKAPRIPFASSLMYEVYRHMPNYTDFTVFKEMGYSGINSGFIDGFVHYHKMTDSAENLDPGSLQHHGSNALALVSTLATCPWTRPKPKTGFSFNPLGSWLIHYQARSESSGGSADRVAGGGYGGNGA